MFCCFIFSTWMFTWWWKLPWELNSHTTRFFGRSRQGIVMLTLTSHQRQTGCDINLEKTSVVCIEIAGYYKSASLHVHTQPSASVLQPFCRDWNMTADTEMDIKEAFQRAQKGHNNKAKLVASLKSRYNKVRQPSKTVIFSRFLVWNTFN